MSHLPAETIERLLDGELGPEEQAAAEAHLAGCAACAGELESLAALFAELGALPPEQPPVDLRPLVLARVAPPPWGPRAWALLITQALLVLGLALALAPLLAPLLGAWNVPLPAFSLPEVALPDWVTSPDELWALLGSGGAIPVLEPLGALDPASWAMLIGIAALAWLLLNGYLLRMAATAEAKKGRS